MSSKESADCRKDSIRSWLLRMGWKEWGVFLLLGNPSSGGRTSGNPKEQ